MHAHYSYLQLLWFQQICRHYRKKRHDFRKNCIEHEACVLISSTTLSEKFPTLRNIQLDIVINAKTVFM
jgi:hypothetical protein